MTVLTKQQNNLPMTVLSVCAAALADFPLSSPCSRLLSLGGGSPVSTGAAHTGHTGDMRHVTGLCNKTVTMLATPQ